jgi:UDP-GlcNAc3NAcA epimerase
MRVVTVVGARPQFIKCAVVSRALRDNATEVLVHTGQHFDYGMSERFFEELDIPEPSYNLAISGGTHGKMTARMMIALEQVIVDEKPDLVMVYGDTNSTLAAAMVAAKLHVPVAHVEAGLRSFNRKMPEEINRIVTDQVSDLLFCPTQNAVELLAKEGRHRGVHFVGDVMYDSVLYNLQRAREQVSRIKPGKYALATIHRPENTDHVDRMEGIFRAMSSLDIEVVLPLHPRTKGILEEHARLRDCLGDNISIVDPLSYLEILVAMADAEVVLTDSGGMQKETYFVGVPCVTLRDETEWPETVDAGVNVIVGADQEMIISAASKAITTPRSSAPPTEGPFGDGKAGEKITQILLQSLQ